MMSFSLAVSKKERMINIIHEFLLIRGNLYLKSVFILISRTEGTEGEGLGEGLGQAGPWPGPIYQPNFFVECGILS